MNLTIRPARVPEDLERLVAIYNTISPDPATAERWLGHEANPPEGRIREWVVATNDHDQIIGFAGAERNPSMKEGVFFCHLRTDPAHRSQGAGTSLLRHIETRAARHGALQLRHAVWEIHPRVSRFRTAAGLFHPAANRKMGYVPGPGIFLVGKQI